MKILVTGGTGYIGSHTVVELQAKGYEVVILDNLSNSNEWVLDSIVKVSSIKPTFLNLDLKNYDALDAFFNLHKHIKGVIHFAAYKAVGESVNEPLKYYENNLYSTINLLKCMDKYQVDNLVFSSSCTVYGQPEKLPVKEDTPVLPANSPYGNTKQICEEIIRETTTVKNLRSIALRYFNPIGAHDTAELGELPIGPPNCLVPYLMQTAIGKRDCLSVFGNDYDTSDGTAIRDYIHVVDLAKAHVIAIKRMIDGSQKEKFEYFNIGTGNGYSVLELINTFEKITAEKFNYEIVARREGDVEKVWADTTKANNELGWKAERELDDMLLTAWNWEKKLKSRGI